MQNLWSRIGQAKCHCKCPSCVFTKAAVARRAATTGRGQFMKPVLQSATFTYSAIFAGAVAIDGGFKQNRRQKLNTELTEAKERLSDRKTAQVAEQDAAEASHDDTQKATFLEQLLVQGVKEAGSKDDALVHGQTDIDIFDGISWMDAQVYDVQDGRKPAWPRNFGPKVDSRRLPPQSLWASDAAAEEAASRPWTHRKLRTLELAVGYFILQTLLKNGLYADGPGKDQQVPASLERWTAMTHYQLVGTTRSLQMAIWEVRNAKLEDWEAVYQRQVGFIPQLSKGMPRYEQDAEGNFRAVQKQLNTSLWTAMNEALGRTDESLHRDLAVRVCHGLLSSGAPPTHKTINLLLVGFTKLNDTISAEDIRKLMSFAHIRANERTCVAVLNHYTLSGDAEGFTHFVQKMRGRGGGLMLARPDLAVDGNKFPNLLVKSDAESRKVVQKVQPTPMVLNAIIAGLLKFVGFDTSLRLVTNLQHDGWGLDKDGLELFLRDCLKARDFENGLRIWQQIKGLEPLDRADADRCAVMLRLCLDCAKEAEFRSIFEEVKHRVAHPETLKFMITNQTGQKSGTKDKWVRNKQHTIPRQMRKLYVDSAAAEGVVDPAQDDVLADMSSSTGQIDGTLSHAWDARADQEQPNESPELRLSSEALLARRHAEAWEDRNEPDVIEEPEDFEASTWSPTVQDESSPGAQKQKMSEASYSSGPWHVSVADMNVRPASRTRDVGTATS